MTIIGGWHMPASDKYFGKFIPADGLLPKRNGFQREHLMEAFKHVKRWDVALDIGAHVGFWTRDMADRFGKVYAFEAALDTFECLVKNTDDLPNVVTRNAGVGHKAGTCRIRHDSKRERGGNTGSRFVEPDKGDVPMLTIDSLGLTACDFIKADVEGFELQVLEGARDTIRSFRPTIIMECDKRFEGRYGVPFGSAEAFLVNMGYAEVAHMRPDKVFVSV